MELAVLPLDDLFWNVGNLTHPNERWATDKVTQQGIKLFLTVRGCEEELRRISFEVRQMVLFSITMEKKLDHICNLSDPGELLFHHNIFFEAS